MSYEVSGTVLSVGDVKEYGARKFKMATVILRIDEDTEYPQEVALEFGGKVADLAGGLSVGHDVTIAFNLRGGKFTTKTGEERRTINLRAWRIVENRGLRAAQQQESDMPPSPFAGNPDLPTTAGTYADEIPY